ncbi:MAG: Brp/Blh family beta-carotene 15,15'-dioxygenase [Myxococcota bacterium]
MRADMTLMLGTVLPWSSVNVGLLLAAGAADQVAPWHLVLFLVLLLFLGVPHGAVDHHVLARLTHRRLLTLAGAGLIGAYILIMLGVLVSWWVAPGLTWGVFLLATVAHWGDGELWYLRQGGLPAGWGWSAAALLLRGGIPLLVPLLAFPGAFEAVSVAVVGFFGGDASAPFAALPAWVGPLWIVLGASLLAYGAARFRAGPWSDALKDVGELLALVLFFALVPSVLSIGLYLCLWHAPRHVLRLLVFDHGPHPDLGAVRRLAWNTVPMTAGAALSFAAALWLVQSGAVEPMTLFAGALAWVAALTAPHMVVVAWMAARDRRAPNVQTA